MYTALQIVGPLAACVTCYMFVGVYCRIMRQVTHALVRVVHAPRNPLATLLVGLVAIGLILVTIIATLAVYVATILAAVYCVTASLRAMGVPV